MIFEPFAPFLASEFQIKFAMDPWEKKASAALRRTVFCQEQGIFKDHDRDAIDDYAIPLVAISLLGVAAGDVVGTVRIHPDKEDSSIWWGSRLAVDKSYRRVGALGSSLTFLAVSSAHARGCKRFIANIQAQNALFFQKLHFRSLGEIEMFGVPHHHMEADLNHYPPFTKPEAGFLSLAKLAA